MQDQIFKNGTKKCQIAKPIAGLTDVFWIIWKESVQNCRYRKMYKINESNEK